ncbi:hypothetical protein [Caenispirillum salinarum]|uniref:hypothetical protein n=1 Tax=Caenispirillum salinarum TaxID=859058 RepID=UPI00384CFE6A
MTAAAGAAAFLLVWTYMTGPDGAPIGGDLTMQPMASMDQCETVGRATQLWLQGHFTDGASWTCVPADTASAPAQSPKTADEPAAARD